MSKLILAAALALSMGTTPGFAQSVYGHPYHHHYAPSHDREWRPVERRHDGYDSYNSIWTPGHPESGEGFIPGYANGS